MSGQLFWSTGPASEICLRKVYLQVVITWSTKVRNVRVRDRVEVSLLDWNIIHISVHEVIEMV